MLTSGERTKRLPMSESSVKKKVLHVDSHVFCITAMITECLFFFFFSLLLPGMKAIIYFIAL